MPASVGRIVKIPLFCEFFEYPARFRHGPPPLAGEDPTCFTCARTEAGTMHEPFENAEDVFRYLDSFHNMERGIPARAFRLDRIEKLAEAAGFPQRCCPSVHAAGSKGKGSTCAMIASILTAAGKRAGLYASPHVEDFRERINLSGEFFSDASYAAAGEELRALVDRIGPGGLPGGEDPTFFELCTVFGFMAFRRERCDAMVIETGLGGRLDATNIIDPLAVVLTPIELEHTEYLGGTIPLVAAEKAGIIKRGRPVFAAAQTAEALAVFRGTAAALDAPLRYLPDETESLDAEVDRNGTRMRVVFRDRSLFSRPLVTRLGLVGEIQARNAALAALCVRVSFPEVTDEQIELGLSRAAIPARFERVLEDPVLVLDGAHTERSVAFAADSFQAAYGKGGILLFACAAGKDADAMARILIPSFSAIFLTVPGAYRKADPDAVRRAFSATPASAAAPVGAPAPFWFDDTAEALEAALSRARALNLPILAVGSFYLAGEIKSWLRGKGRV